MFIIGCALSLVLLAAIIWRLDWAIFWSEIRKVHLAWLVPAMIFIVLGIAMRSLRWNLAAGAPLREIPLFWNAAVIGLAVNHIYPLRAGEIVRIFALRQLAAIPLGRAATSALVDRLSDAMLLGACAVAVVATHTGIPYAERLAAGTLVLACGALAALILFAKSEHLWGRLLVRLSSRLQPDMQERVNRFYGGVVETTRLVASPLQLVRILLITTVAFGCDLAVMYSVTRAFGWELPLIASATVLVFLAIGTSLPAAPGYAGVFQLACVLALALFGISESPAVAYSIVLQLCVLGSIVPLAALSVFRHRDLMRRLRHSLAKMD